MNDVREEEGSTRDRDHFWVRRDADPDRGGIILFLGTTAILLGVVSLCWFAVLVVGWYVLGEADPRVVVSRCCFGLPTILSLALGASAWMLGNQDEFRMGMGRMNPASLRQTQRGRDLGIVAVLCSGAGVLIYSTSLVLLF